MLLVDDENIFLNHLRNAIDWEKYGCVICKEVMDGKETIQAVKSLKPDIVFMDINLPNMNGLDVCDVIRNFTDPPYVIVLTAHSEFNFAQKAIKLDVFDYLLKPFDTQELINALEKCIDEMQRAKANEDLQKQKEADELERYFKDLLELGRAGGGGQLPEVLRDLKFIAAAVRMHDLCHEDLLDIREDIAAIDQKLNISSYITGTYYGAAVVIHTMDREIEMQQLIAAYGEVLESGIQQGKKYDCVALGDFVSSRDEIARSYHSATLALENRSRIGGFVVTHQDIKNLSYQGVSFSMQDINLLIKLFETGQHEQADEVIEKIFALSEGHMLSFQYVFYVYYSLLMNIYSRYQYRDKKSRDYMQENKIFINELNTCITTKEIVEILKNYIHEAFSDCMEVQVPTRSGILVKKIEHYLMEHFNESDLSVNQIAQALFFENSYIRRVYKIQTGKTIMQHLEEIRIERSKELLEQTKLKSGEIAYMAGYADPLYFSKRFKLYAGLSPTDYRMRKTQDE